MRRFVLAWCVIAVTVGGFALTEGGSPASADSGSDATIAALETQVASQATTITQRGRKINDQRTQIAKQRNQLDRQDAQLSVLAAAVPTSTPEGYVFDLDGSGDQVSEIFEITVPATYRLTAQSLEGKFLAVRVYTAAGDWLAGLSVETTDTQEHSGVDSLDAGKYYIQVVANGSWTVHIQPLQ